MKTLIQRAGLLALVGLTLLCGLLRPCAAQKPTLYDVSWAGNSNVPELRLNVRGGVDDSFSAFSATWACVGSITGTSVSQDARGLHVDVAADVLFASVEGDDYAEPIPASAVLHVTITPNGKVSEFVEVEGASMSLVTPERPVTRGGVYFFWLP